MRKIKFIINPAAGQGESKDTIRLIHDKMEVCDMMYSISISGFQGDVENIARDAVKNGYTDVIAVGGDGTVLETLNGIIDTETTLGIIPAGTGNDFIKMISKEKSFESFLDKIIEGKTKRIDIGMVNNKKFLNVVAMGIDGDIVNMTSKVKKYLKGSSAYLYSTFASLLKFKCKDVRIEIDDKVFHRKVYLVAVGNGSYFGGGMKITPGAMLDSENFEVVIINSMTKTKFSILFRKVFTGEHVHEKTVEVFYGKKIKIISKDNLYVNADGNIIGNGKAKIEVLPKYQNVII